MKKIIGTILAIIAIFAFSISSFAEMTEFDNITVEAKDDGTVTVDALVKDDSILAVMIQIYSMEAGEENERIAVSSFGVKDQWKMTDVPLETEKQYIVKIARFSGGDWYTKEFMVEKPETPEKPVYESNGTTVTQASTKVSDSSGAVSGVWVYEPASGRWTFAYNGIIPKACWLKVFNPYAGNVAQWFYFDPTGFMCTGWTWIKDSDGVTRCYYLNPTHDNSFGACYLNGKTPDGWMVDKNGAWIVNRVVQTK